MAIVQKLASTNLYKAEPSVLTALRTPLLDRCEKPDTCC